MKKFTIILFILAQKCCFSQIVYTPPVLNGGMIMKSQLWNFIITNASQTKTDIRIQISFFDIRSGQPVLNALTGFVHLEPGINVLNSSKVAPVQYNSTSPDFYLDPNPNGMLPIGNFKVCYSISQLQNVHSNKVSEDCFSLSIPPASPPLLISPENKKEIASSSITFNWLPPSPIESLNSVIYDLKISEILINQSKDEAIRNNTEVLLLKNLPSATTTQNRNAVSPLEENKKYAWQITAKTGMNEWAKSDIWEFTIPKNKDSQIVNLNPFAKLTNQPFNNTNAFYSHIKFSYINETSDSIWNISFTDLSTPQHKTFALIPGGIKMKAGENLIDYNAAHDNRFINDHIYTLGIVNSRKEFWQLKFQYIAE